MPLFGLIDKALEGGYLIDPVDKACCSLWHHPIASSAPARNPEQKVGRDRLGFAFEGERPDRIDAGILLRRQPGRLAHQNRTRLGRLLQPGGEVRGVADRGVQSKVTAYWAKDDGTGMNADAYREVESPIGRATLVPELPPNAERRQQSAPHMVFMGQRGAENRHETVTGEFWHGPVVAPHLGDRDFEKSGDEIAHRLGSEPFGQGGRADDVAEQYADLLHFAGMCGRGSQARRQQRRFGETRRAVSVEWCGATAAKPVFRRVCRAARWARGTQRRRALSAEPHAGGILGVTPRASHAGPPRCSGMLRRRKI